MGNLRPLIRWLVSLTLYLLNVLALANTRVVIVSSDQTAAYKKTAQTLMSSLQSKGVAAQDIRWLTVVDFSKQSVELRNTVLHVALGASATEALAATSLPVLSALIPRSSFERILQRNALQSSANLTAIFLDHPFSRQLALIKIALPNTKRIGVLWGADSWPKAQALRAAAVAQDFVLAEAGLSNTLNLFSELQQVLNDSDVFLAVADPQVFNSNTIQNLLLTTFRAEVPVVAFSPAYVQAGALLALHTTPEQVGRQLADMVMLVLSGKSLPDQPIEADDFEVSVNTHVARSMHLALDPKALRIKLRHLLGLP